MRVPQEVVNEIISHVEWPAFRMRHIVSILEASVPVFSPQICANFRKRYVDFRVDNHHYLASMFALCPAIKDSIWHVNIERNKPRTRTYREEELELARLLDACTSVRGLSINLCIQGWTEGLLYDEQRQAILRAMQRPNLEYLALFRVRLQEEDEDAFRSLALPASLRVVKLCGVSVFGIHPNKAAGPAAPATPSPSLDSLIVDERSLGFVRLMNLASCQSLTRLDFTSADKHVNDNHVVAQLLRANAQLQHLILRNDYHAEFPVYDLSHNSALRSVIVLIQRSAPLVIENIARALCSIPETVALETFTLCFPPERGEIGMQDSRHWQSLEDALLCAGVQAPRVVKLCIWKYTDRRVSSLTKEHFCRTVRDLLPRLDERGILEVVA